MNRVRLKSIVRMFAILLLIGVISALAFDFFLSQENLLRATERAMHYGPSDEILYRHTGKDGAGMIVSRCGSEGLSVSQTQRRLGFLWSLAGNGPNGYQACNAPVNIFYSAHTNCVFGIVYDSSVAYVRAYFFLPQVESAYAPTDHFVTAVPDENGFFIAYDVHETILPGVMDYRNSPLFYNLPYAEAYSADGDVIARSREPN